jgi:vacuolar-type H+-ATPase subunit F/Vma7
VEKKLVVVIGDTHHHIGLAVAGLERIEAEFGRGVDQVFSVGDLGLFLAEEDWAFLSGPRKYRHPENSPALREAWACWRWPLSQIAGNHEPLHRLRDWQADYFGGKLRYTDAGMLEHSVTGLRVAGLSGIYHPEHLEFRAAGQKWPKGQPAPNSWREMVDLAARGVIGRERLTYYKESEVKLLKNLDSEPHLLLLHDWPMMPEISQRTMPQGRRPEAEIVTALQPKYVCCGHHHMQKEYRLGETQVLALNIISSPTLLLQGKISAGWAAVFEWDGASLDLLETWPESHAGAAPHP